MSHSHINRNHASELSMIKQAIQYAFFLVVCIWLLYQIHHSLYVRRDSDCHFVDNRLTDESIADVLGRKGGVRVRTSHYNEVEEMEFYGVDLIGEAVSMNNVTDGDLYQSDKPDFEGNGVIGSLENVVNEMGNSSMEGGAEMVMSENRGNENDEYRMTEVNGVILKKDEEVKIFRFGDENGVPEHESEPYRRSDAEMEIPRKRNVSKAGNETEKMEECEDACTQTVTGKYQSSESESKATEKEMPNLGFTVRSEKGSMRDPLFS